MAGPDRIAKLARQLDDLASGAAQGRVVNAAGLAGKKAALAAAAADLGADRRFSGMRRKTALGVGYEAEGFAARIGFRPAGLWKLAESGRQQSGRIYPRSGRGRRRGVVAGRAVMTPQGPRSASSYGPSRGLGTFSEAVNKARSTVGEAAIKAIAAEIKKF